VATLLGISPNDVTVISTKQGSVIATFSIAGSGGTPSYELASQFVSASSTPGALESVGLQALEPAEIIVAAGEPIGVGVAEGIAVPAAIAASTTAALTVAEIVGICIGSAVGASLLVGGAVYTVAKRRSVDNKQIQLEEMNAPEEHGRERAPTIKERVQAKFARGPKVVSVNIGKYPVVSISARNKNRNVAAHLKLDESESDTN